MAYRVKESFPTLQGEGAWTGRAAVFLRFSACNLWSGREEDRATAHCRFCDTDFVGIDGQNGGRFTTPDALAEHVEALWESAAPGEPRRYVVCTGGEPLLQLDAPLVEALHARGFEIGIETNGTLAAPEGIDWICVSPKPGPPLVQRTGDEFKLVYPQAGLPPERYEGLDFTHFFLSPMDGPERERNTRAAIEYCRRHPRWRLNLQTHKFLGIP